MRAVAERIGMSESGFIRGAKRGTLSAENLLALAESTDTPPSFVLRLAGKGALADAIERLYGPGTESLTATQRELLAMWDQIDDECRAPLRFTMRMFVAGAKGLGPPGAPRDVGSTGVVSASGATPRSVRTRRGGHGRKRR